MTEKLSKFEKANESIQDRIDLNECFNYSFDVARLFINYYIAPELRVLNQYKHYNTWALFNEHVTNLRKQITDENTEKVLNDFVQPLQAKLNVFNINILSLHQLIQRRNFLTHHYIRSSSEQKSFIQSLEEYNFSCKIEHRTLVQQMLQLLKNTKLKRFVN